MLDRLRSLHSLSLDFQRYFCLIDKKFALPLLETKGLKYIYSRLLEIKICRLLIFYSVYDKLGTGYKKGNKSGSEDYKPLSDLRFV